MWSNPKEDRVRSKKYLDWVKELPCCICGAPSDEAHHLISVGLGGIMGDKIDDVFTIPVCRIDHSRIHQDVKGYDQVFYLLRTLLKAFRTGVLVVNL